MSTNPGNKFSLKVFGEKLKILRVSRPGSPSLAEFGALLGVSKASLSRYESGETEPPVSLLEPLIVQVGAEALSLIPGASDLHKTIVTGMLPDHVEQAYIILCEILDKVKATPADGDRKVVARILGKAARELGRGAPVEEVRSELAQDTELFLGILR